MAFHWVYQSLHSNRPLLRATCEVILLHLSGIVLQFLVSHGDRIRVLPNVGRQLFPWIRALTVCLCLCACVCVCVFENKTLVKGMMCVCVVCGMCVCVGVCVCVKSLLI